MIDVFGCIIPHTDGGGKQRKIEGGGERCVFLFSVSCMIDVFGCIIPHTEGGGGQRKIEGGGEKEMGGVGG